MDLTTEILGSGTEGKQEKPLGRLKEWLTVQPGLSSREADVLDQLVELVRVVLRLDQRLNHVRDEADKGRAAAQLGRGSASGLHDRLRLLRTRQGYSPGKQLIVSGGPMGTL